MLSNSYFPPRHAWLWLIEIEEGCVCVCVWKGGWWIWSPEAIHVHLAAHLPYGDLSRTAHIWFQLKNPNMGKCYGPSLWEMGDGWMWVWEGGRRGVVEVGVVPLWGFFMCVERPQHSNLFHIPKTNQAGYFHSGRGLMVEVGLKRVGGATEQHIKCLLFLGSCTYCYFLAETPNHIKY